MKHFKLISILLLAMYMTPSQVSCQSDGIIHPLKLKEVSVAKAKIMVQNGALMVDVREQDEVAERAYDIENILLIPLSELKNRMNELPKDKQLVMVCRSGNRSRKASHLLLDNGFDNLVNMEGGILDWEEKKLGVIINGKATKKACCANPNSKKCNPDGSCKKPINNGSCKKAINNGKKACCSKNSNKKGCSSKPKKK